MALDKATLIESVKNYIDKNNTTTSSFDISSGLAKRVQMVVKGDITQKPVPNILYPYVFVRLQSHLQEIAQLGNSPRREHELNIQVGAVTQYGVALGQDHSENEIYELSENIENLIRNDLTLSSTVDYVDEMETFYETVGEEKTWNETAQINLTCRKLST